MTVNKKKRNVKKQIDDLYFEHKGIEHVYEGEFKEYLQCKQTITENLNYKDYAESYIESQIKCIKNVLLENHFIDSEDKLTEKGTIACNVHEMNNLVFPDLYQHTNGFDSHSPVDIACLLSLFYDIKVSDDVKSFSTNILVDDVRFINDQLNKYQNIEAKFQLSSTNNYTIQYDMLPFIKSWFDVESIEDAKFLFHEIKKEKNIFISDFVKCCMKIINMANEVTYVSELVENYTLKEKSIILTNKLKKFIVSCDSLYV